MFQTYGFAKEGNSKDIKEGKGDDAIHRIK